MKKNSKPSFNTPSTSENENLDSYESIENPLSQNNSYSSNPVDVKTYPAIGNSYFNFFAKWKEKKYSCLKKIKLRIITLLPDTKHPATRQVTPIGANRHLLLVVYMVYAFLTGCIYFGWTSLYQLLIRSGAYKWKCLKDENGEYIDDTTKIGKIYTCDLQDASLAPLFTISLASHSMFSAVAGILLDTIGPKKTAMIGQTFNTLAWVILAFCSEDFPMYILAMVFMGFGADTGYLPLLPISNLFPRNSAFIITILGSCNTASFSIPSILQGLWSSFPESSFNQICFAYVGFGTFFCFVLASIFIPCESFKGTDQYDEFTSDSLEICSLAKSLCASKSAHSIDLKNYVKSSSNWNSFCDENISAESEQNTNELTSGERLNPDFTDLPTACPNHTHLKDYESDIFSNTRHSDSIRPKIDDKISSEDSRKKALEKDSPDHISCMENARIHHEIDSATIEVSQNNSSKNPSRHKPLWKQILSPYSMSMAIYSSIVQISQRWKVSNLWKQMLSAHFIGIAVYSALVQFTESYVLNAQARMFDIDVQDTLNILEPFSFIPCIIIGKCIDHFGIMNLLFFIHTAGVLSFVCILIVQPHFFHYAAIVFFSIYICVDGDQIFCYVENTFHSRSFGKLSGIAIAFGGLGSLLSIPLYQTLTIEILEGETFWICISLTIMLVLGYLLLGYMYSLKKKKPKLFGDEASRKEKLEQKLETKSSENFQEESANTIVKEKSGKEGSFYHEQDKSSFKGMTLCSF